MCAVTALILGGGGDCSQESEVPRDLCASEKFQCVSQVGHEFQIMA